MQTEPLDALKQAILHSSDLAMRATAARFNLDQPADRKRSSTILSRLFFDLANLAEIELFIEVGAREAAASTRAKAWFPEARVVAFEASPYTYENNSTRLAGKGIEYHHLAAATSSGDVIINVHRDERGAPIANGEASLLKRTKSARDREHGFEEVRVPAVALDDFFAADLGMRSAVWIDVEGGCGLVLPGATKLLSNASVVIVEVEDQAYWGEEHWLRSQTLSFLYDLGLIPVARDFEYAHQHNVVLLRRELLDGPGPFRAALARFTSTAVLPTEAQPQRQAESAPSTPKPTPARSAAPKTGPEKAVRVAKKALRRSKRLALRAKRKAAALQARSR
ncbi:hypothetical protein GCM10009547_36480 [Sporichthya brevicatena]|uniref:Methyltransferase FkbM domain-containing protein n=1 Tax=Sporichthya brevicatena TaxID=171442 RepID=A0ABN1H5L8_9ACTN